LLIAAIVLFIGVVALRRFKLNPGKTQRDPTYLKKTFDGWALITGASSGIGLDIADILASEGYDVIITARRQEQLEKISKDLTSKYGVQVKIVISDLSKPEGPKNLFNEVKDLDIGLVINNAGAGWFGNLRDQGPEHIEQIIQLNCTSMALLTRFFVEKLRKREKESGMIITSSLGAYLPIPLTATYASAKAMASMFGCAVAFEELKDNSKVRITVLEPGATATEFGKVATQGKVTNEGRTDLASSRDVANIALNYLAAKVTVCIPTDKDYFLSLLTAVLPRLTASGIVYSKYKDFAK